LFILAASALVRLLSLPVVVVVVVVVVVSTLSCGKESRQETNYLPKNQIYLNEVQYFV
jgi:hypothetical protein